MIIKSTDSNPRTIHNYDFLMTGGIMLPFAIDEVAGDTYDIQADCVIIKIAARLALGLSKSPAMEHTIFAKHIISITHTEHEVIPPTPDQEAAFRNTIHQLSQTIQ